ncbi:TrkA family potassium uptake protein [Halobaculum sp. WSA2]|uniref:TrkA family potassium uptake protein n=1 Tax=Halobaculum saliterrae TaxID=2073113 RepID=A0A6B0SQ88_9EURY|nr:potassium channel protein [Halobaculum saliterrae]MXR41088.1 TrkA family potassium uptake protein [Halobaculum saliterrae]
MSRIPWSSRTDDLSRRSRLIIYYVAGLAALVLLYTVLYNTGMRALEGRPQSIFRSFQTVTETMTTTGYGADSPWESPWMNLFMVFMQLSGIGVGFFTLRVIVIPLFTGAEVDLDSRLSRKSDHVVICEYDRDSAVLLEELEHLEIDYVLISSDEEEAIDLSDEGYSAIHGSPQETSAFERASIGNARAVITDAGEANVDTVLTVRSLRPDVEIITLTDDSSLRDVLLATGADSVLSPRAVLGERLARKAMSLYTSELHDTVGIAEGLEVTEISVSHGSPLEGVSIRNSRIRERTGANVAGAWIDGELQLPPDPDAVIGANTVLLVSGDHDALEELGETARPVRRRRREEGVVVAGLGEVGHAALSVVEEEADVPTTTVDVVDSPDVDVVGDVSSRETLREAGVEDAGVILVCVPDDSTALLTTVLARSLNPDIEILVRMSDAKATTKALRAGADYVLSVPRISARMVARELRGEEVLGAGSQIRIDRVSADPFAGKTLAESGISARTGCRVIAIEHEGELTTSLDPERTIAAGDRLVIVGSDESVQRFLTTFDVSPKPLEE